MTQSKILKKSMMEKFEELRDHELIEAYEKKTSTRKTQFARADDLIKRITKANKS